MRFILVLSLVGCGGSSNDSTCTPARAYACSNCGAGDVRYAVTADTAFILEPPAIFPDGSLALATCSDVWFGKPDASKRLASTALPANSQPSAIAADPSGGVYVDNTIIVPGDPPVAMAPSLVALDAKGKVRWQLDGVGAEALYPGDAGPYALARGTLMQYAAADGSVIAMWTGADAYAPTPDGHVAEATTAPASGNQLTLALLSAPGTVVWTKTITADGTLYGFQLAATATGVWIVGQGDNATTVNFGDATVTLAQSGVHIAAFVAAIDATTGTTQWAHAFAADNLQGLSVAGLAGGTAVVSAELSDASNLVASEPDGVSGIAATFDASGLVHAVAFAGAAPSQVTASSDGTVWVTLVGENLIFGTTNLGGGTAFYADYLP